MKRGYAHLEMGGTTSAVALPAAPAEPAGWAAALAVFEALSRRGRLAVFRTIVRAGAAGCDAAQLGRELGMTGSALTLHLRGLGEAGLISVRAGRTGRFVADLERLSTALLLLESERPEQ